MKIHIISNSLKMNSGYSNVSKYLALGLQKLGYSITMTGMQNAHWIDYSYGIQQFPIQTDPVDETTQLVMNINSVNPDVVMCIFQSDLQSLFYIPRLFKKTIFYTTIEGSRVPGYTMNLFKDIIDNGGKIVVPTQFAYNEILKESFLRFGAGNVRGGMNMTKITVIPYGYNDKVFKKIDNFWSYCYYCTDVGQNGSDPLMLHKQGCFDCHYNRFGNTSTKDSCQYYKEENVSILRWMDETGKTGTGTGTKRWLQKDIPISKLKDQFKGKFVYLCVAQNFGVRKRYERLLNAYAIMIGESEQKKARTELHLHTWPISILGINLIEEIKRLGIEENVSFSYADFRSSGWSEDALAVLMNIADCHVTASSGEGFNLPTLESMACGTPVIAPDFTSFPELIGDKDMKKRLSASAASCQTGATASRARGLLAEVPPESIQMTETTSYKGLVNQKDLCENMKWMYNNGELRKECSENCIRFVKDFVWDKQIVKWDKLLKTFV